MSTSRVANDDAGVDGGRVIMQIVESKQGDVVMGLPSPEDCAALTEPAKADNTREFVRMISPESANSARSVSREFAAAEEDEEDEHDHGHDHVPKPASILTAAASALINFLLMFGLCCAYGLIMLPDDWNARHRGLAVKMNLATAMLMGLALAMFSGVPVAIGGPDLNPVVFLSMFIAKVAEKIAEEKGLTLPNNGAHRRLLDSCDAALRSNDYDLGEVFRRLAGGASGGSAEEFCTGVHYYGDAANSDHMADCDAYHAELRATMVFTVMVSSAVLGILYYVLGKFKLTRFVAYIPTNIMEAFLSCIGYKVFKYALKFSKFKPTQFIPAACIGVPLYFVKALHVGNPAIVIPAMLLVPLGLFYLVVYGSGNDVNSARDGGWMFDPPLEYVDFWVVWSDSIVGRDGGWFSDVNFGAWASTLVDLPIMLVVCTMDCMLKLHSTESKLPVKANKDEEIKLYGLSNALTTLSGGSVGYMQLKFNVINAGVMGNVTDRRGGILYAVLCGACWIGTTELFNWMPRFFLSALLFFAGAGFVAENLWGSRKYLSTPEWLQILVILGIFIMFNSLLAAVIVGGLIAGSAFIARYAKVPCFTGPIAPVEIPLNSRRNPMQQASIQHIMGAWVVIYNLKGFIFFASASKLIETLTERVKSQCETGVGVHTKLRWIIFDCSQLDGLDSSASKAFAKFAAFCKKSHLNVHWASLPDTVKRQLQSVDTIKGTSDCHRNLSYALLHIESKAVEYAIKMQKKLEQLHPRFQLVRDYVDAQEQFEPFRNVLGEDSRFGCPWAFCGRLEMRAFETVIWTPDEFNRELLLVHSGRIGLFASIPTEPDEVVGEKGELGMFLGIYGRGKFLNAQALTNGATRYYAVAVEDGYCVTWKNFQWSRLRRERPAMAAAIFQAALKQEVLDGAEAKAHLSNTGAGKVTTASAAPQSIVPPDMHRALGGLDVAAGLRKLGLYDIAEGPESNEGFVAFVAMAMAEELPLPGSVTAGLEVAWSTYATDDGLAAEDLQQALMYAGVFHLLMDIGDQKTHFRKDEFMACARRGLVIPLNKLQARTCKDMFDRYAGSKGYLTRAEMVNAFQQMIFALITVEEVEALASVWAATSDGRVDFTSFLTIISRFAKLYEIYWHMLSGIEALMGRDVLERNTQLTVQELVNATKLDNDSAQELLWVADVHHGLGHGTTLDVRMIAAMLLVSHRHGADLPPPPVVHARSFESCQAAGQVSPRPGCAKEGPHCLDIVDTRSLQNREALGEVLARSRSLKDKWQKRSRDVVDKRKVDAQGSAATTGETQVAVDEKQVPKHETPAAVPNLPVTGAKAKLHLLLEEPNSSPMANKISLIMGLLIAVSVLTLVTEPLVSPPGEEVPDSEQKTWFIFEAFFTAIFLIEFIMRFLVADALGTQTKLGFIKAPMNVCDFVAILPFFVDLILQDMDQSSLRLFRVARLMRLSRVVRLGRLAKRSAVFAPIALIFVVIWGTYMKNALSES